MRLCRDEEKLLIHQYVKGGKYRFVPVIEWLKKFKGNSREEDGVCDPIQKKHELMHHQVLRKTIGDGRMCLFYVYR